VLRRDHRILRTLIEASAAENWSKLSNKEIDARKAKVLERLEFYKHFSTSF
jgi:hypothetical protein